MANNVILKPGVFTIEDPAYTAKFEAAEILGQELYETLMQHGIENEISIATWFNVKKQFWIQAFIKKGKLDLKISTLTDMREQTWQLQLSEDWRWFTSEIRRSMTKVELEELLIKLEKLTTLEAIIKYLKDVN